MTAPRAPRRTVVASVVLGAMIGVAFLGRDALPLGLAIGGGSAAWLAWRMWLVRRHATSRLAHMEARWLCLPGAEIDKAGRIHVHHGDQPISIRLASEGDGHTVEIATAIGELPAAFRCWPAKRRPPSMDPEGSPVGGPPVDRSPALERRLGGALRVDTSDEEVVGRLLDDDVTAPLMAATSEALTSFGGLTYDGRMLRVHLRGPVIADPQRATHLARLLWEPWLP